MTLHLPFAIFAAAAAIYISAQIGSITQGNKTAQWQLTNLGTQMTNLRDAQVKMTALGAQRTELIKQAEQVQSQYTSLLSDVIALAQTDSDAKSVIEKWNIKANQPAEAKKGDQPKVNISTDKK